MLFLHDNQSRLCIVHLYYNDATHSSSVKAENDATQSSSVKAGDDSIVTYYIYYIKSVVAPSAPPPTPTPTKPLTKKACPWENEL